MSGEALTQVEYDFICEGSWQGGSVGWRAAIDAVLTARHAALLDERDGWRRIAEHEKELRFKRAAVLARVRGLVDEWAGERTQVAFERADQLRAALDGPA